MLTSGSGERRCTSAKTTCGELAAISATAGAGPRQALQLDHHQVGDLRELAPHQRAEHHARVDAVDHDRRIAAVRLPLTIGGDHGAVVIDRRLRADSADDPQSVSSRLSPDPRHLRHLLPPFLPLLPLPPFLPLLPFLPFLPFPP